MTAILRQAATDVTARRVRANWRGTGCTMWLGHVAPRRSKEAARFPVIVKMHWNAFG